MAGIGFELYKILHEGTLSSILKAFFFGIIIVAGPWILSVICIYSIQKFAATAIEEDPVLFSVSVVYVYAFSLTIFGGLHYVFSRYIADMMYIENKKNITTALVTVVILTIGIATIIGIVFIQFNDFSFIANGSLYGFALVLLYILVNIIWIMLIYVALLKEYNKIFFAYLIGICGSVAGVYFFGHSHGVAGALLGYGLGQLIIIVLLGIVAQRSYPIYTVRFNLELLVYFKKFFYLFMTGLLFNAAIWSDKMLYWFYRGVRIEGTLFYYFIDYDIPVFIAYLTMIPGLVYFLVVSETIFHRDYTVFIKNLLSDTLQTIIENKKKMLQSMKRGLWGLVLFQGIWTGGLILNNATVIKIFGFTGMEPVILNILFVAIFFQMLTMILHIYLLYLELRMEALLSTLVFFVINFGLSVIMVFDTTIYPGISYLIASIFPIIYCGYQLIKKAPIIDFIIFSKT